MHFIEDEINKSSILLNSFYNLFFFDTFSTVDDSRTLFREESVATRLLSSYNYVDSSIKFLKKVISPLIKEVQNFKHGLEVSFFFFLFILSSLPPSTYFQILIN